MLASVLDTVLDRTVAPGYSRLGYLARSAGWSGAQADPEPGALSGKVALVTGGGGGLGLATVTGLARLGASVHLVARDTGRGAAARAQVAAAVPGADLHVTRCDVSDLDDVRRAGEVLAAAGPDVLVHNAGVLPPGRTESPQGHELCLATHVLGPHLLTRLLADALGGGRVLWISSGGMYAQKLTSAEPVPYNGTTAYARTKRMQVVLSGLWAARGLDSHAVHPGWADTPGLASSLPGFGKLVGRLLRTAEQGADTAVWLAAARRSDAGTGRFWHDRAPRPEHYVPWTRETPDERDALWSRVQALTS
ncbi:SDR family NAD(P)-dependent oxidoreductase [Pseudonocardia abyssalis]|uniref:SDR family NAD(P)-dependent oxidoreductase n=1 Tax=Pseudonocardia abyssalis TaxID=2792008 RepID=A0ABS6UTT3_9PSEU|nr:SDR family NAD(P)-dependent oxidoreductase [Pseudonocardia abyssalis]MBW0117506.1 SDR family NAD(P)-dependent oxidoreductase [Pseudonocardia abyssalis]MBW0135268.1 SDR family NAD(P)-dependent oxidoreductase [Pseudonocardia abyssalis]